MNTANRYVSQEDVFKHIDNDGLLVGNNAEWAKEAVWKSDGVFLDYFIPVREIDDIVKCCNEKIEHYQQLGLTTHAECYRDFVNMLRALPEVD